MKEQLEEEGWVVKGNQIKLVGTGNISWALLVLYKELTVYCIVMICDSCFSDDL